MAAQMQKVINNHEQYIQHEGTQSKVPVQPTIDAVPLELLHIDFTSIETMMGLEQPPNMGNIFVFCDHFMKHIVAYDTLDQTARTIATFLWSCYISIFRAPARLLRD